MSIFGFIEGIFTDTGKDVETLALDLGLSATKIRDLWGMALGVAQAVETLDPAISPLIVEAMKIAGPIVADIEAGLSTGQQLIALSDAAVNLQLVAGPNVTVTANAKLAA